MKTLRTIILAAVAAPVFLTPAIAQDATSAAVKARQSHMQLYAFNLGILGGMARGNMDYDADTAQAAADNMLALASMAQGSYWPQGSDSDSVEGSRALPALWADFPGVMQKGGEAKAAIEALAMVAGDGLEAVQGALGPVGAACGACHQAYRVPN